MGWLWSLMEDFRDADSFADWVNLVNDNILVVGAIFMLAMLARHGVGKGVRRAKMTQIEAGMESGWATRKDIKETGLFE